MKPNYTININPHIELHNTKTKLNLKTTTAIDFLTQKTVTYASFSEIPNVAQYIFYDILSVNQPLYEDLPKFAKFRPFLRLFKFLPYFPTFLLFFLFPNHAPTYVLFPLSNVTKEQKPNTGNYYIYFSGNPSLSSSNATDSICPYGWQLVEYEVTSQKTFSNLTNTYLSFSNTHNSAIYSSGGLRTDITLLSFLRSGYYRPSDDSGAPSYQGTYGYYWSLYSRSDANAYDLAFYYIYVFPQYYFDARGNGYPIRCLAR